MEVDTSKNWPGGTPIWRPGPSWARQIVPWVAMRCTAREWVGPLAVGGRADVCMAQPVPTLARPRRQAGRHPRGVPLARVRADLLAVATQDLEDRLSECPLLRFPSSGVAVWDNSVRASLSRPYNRLTFAHHCRRTPRCLHNHPVRHAYLRLSVHHRSRCLARRTPVVARQESGASVVRLYVRDGCATGIRPH